MSSGWAPSVLAALAGLVVMAGTTAAWKVERGAAQVGGVDVAQVQQVTGVELRPMLLLVGLLLLLAAVPLGIARGAVRRAVGAVIGAAGMVGVVLTGVTVLATFDMAGALQPAPGLVGVGCLAGTAAGWLAARRPGTGATLPHRFDLDPSTDDRAGAPDPLDADPRRAEVSLAGEDVADDPNHGDPGPDEWHLAAEESEEPLEP